VGYSFLISYSAWRGDSSCICAYLPTDSTFNSEYTEVDIMAWTLLRAIILIGVAFMLLVILTFVYAGLSMLNMWFEEGHVVNPIEYLKNIIPGVN
jgi:hypothetical protein